MATLIDYILIPVDFWTIIHAHAIGIDMIDFFKFRVSKCNQSKWPSNCIGFHGHHVMWNSSILTSMCSNSHWRRNLVICLGNAFCLWRQSPGLSKIARGGDEIGDGGDLKKSVNKWMHTTRTENDIITEKHYERHQLPCHSLVKRQKDRQIKKLGPPVAEVKSKTEESRLRYVT